MSAFRRTLAYGLGALSVLRAEAARFLEEGALAAERQRVSPSSWKERLYRLGEEERERLTQEFVRACVLRRRLREELEEQGVASRKDLKALEERLARLEARIDELAALLRELGTRVEEA
ncbi:MAG: hypothetical protein BLITH_0884 [Brockia lithotrophica]|uniref:Polyhydroxyalkanoate synthesis regulator phasin n=1 Tax=Brockia lithotrophica TaxID=933949 RepID=A0A2T5G940_9BACL|nr:hypothetical protein [Brockia lithotrophica]PTQ52705.1 MAG: hypothetical protein BLITH_0884 [Brockia lithotrophica]